MTLSAYILGLTGITLSFLPHEIIRYATSAPGTALAALMMQLVGALYFGFAMMNYTARANLIGGIYGRPIAIGNLTHFIIGALALVKLYFATQLGVILGPAIVYAVFAIWFSVVFYTHPVKNS